MAQLTEVKAKSLNPGTKAVADGTVTGLYLMPGNSRGRGKWVLRYTSPTSGKRRDMGLGAYPDVSIATARRVAGSAREAIRDGVDPIEQAARSKAERLRLARAMTFEEAARAVHQTLGTAFRNAKHRDQWINTLTTYVFPALGGKRVEELRVQDFAEALRPIWLSKAETATRVKQRCASVMDWCVAQGIIQASPVSVVTKLLPRQPGKSERVRHQPAMAWRDVPVFMRDTVRSKPSAARHMLEFLILTAARSGEVRGMTWDEVDWNKRLWVIPASRMKAKSAHRVPLSPVALGLLERQKSLGEHETIVFPSPTGRMFTDMALTKFLRDHKVMSGEGDATATAHGFRSSFRDWASEHSYARDLAERALAHTVANAVEAAYHRTDLMEQRRPMMEAWADWVDRAVEGSVVAFRGREAG